jgi:hypothetical protein
MSVLLWSIPVWIITNSEDLLNKFRIMGILYGKDSGSRRPALPAAYSPSPHNLITLKNGIALCDLHRRKKIKTGPSAGSGFSESDEMIIQV